MTTYTTSDREAQPATKEVTKVRREAKPYINPYLAGILLGNALESEVERLFEKEIGLGVKTLIPLEDVGNGLLELDSLHRSKTALPAGARSYRSYALFDRHGRRRQEPVG